MRGMTVDEISRYAASGKMPEEKTNCADRCLYYALRDLYAKHRENQITKEDGEKLKRKALNEYQKDCEELNYSGNFLMREAEMWKRIEFAAIKYRKEPSIENADLFLEAVYGCGRKKE